MRIENLKADLDRANGALVEKLGKQPYLPLSLSLTDSGRWVCGGAYLDDYMRERLTGSYEDTPEAAMASIFEIIADMPSPEDRVTHEYLSKVAAAVDYATEHSLPDEYVAPLRGVSVAMTENLLTHEVTP